jgi:hypothetical protein
MNAFDRLNENLEGFGYVLKERDLNDGFGGDLCGKVLYVTSDLSVEQKVFIRIHFASHSAQWHIDPPSLVFSESLLQGLDERELDHFIAPEHEAHCLGLGLLERLEMFGELGEWYTQVASADLVGIQKHFLGYAKEFSAFSIQIFPEYTPTKLREVKGGIFVNWQ